MEGIKYDTGKPDLNLVFSDFSRALYYVGEVGTYGAKKYAPSNWLKVDKGYERYTSAMYRHQLESHSQPLDESGFLHDGLVAWNALAKLELKLREIEDATRGRNTLLNAESIP